MRFIVPPEVQPASPLFCIHSQYGGSFAIADWLIGGQLTSVLNVAQFEGQLCLQGIFPLLLQLRAELSTRTTNPDTHNGRAIPPWLTVHSCCLASHRATQLCYCWPTIRKYSQWGRGSTDPLPPWFAIIEPLPCAGTHILRCEVLPRASLASCRVA